MKSDLNTAQLLCDVWNTAEDPGPAGSKHFLSVFPLSVWLITSTSTLFFHTHVVFTCWNGAEYFPATKPRARLLPRRDSYVCHKGDINGFALSLECIGESETVVQLIPG